MFWPFKNRLKFKIGDKLRYIKTGGNGGENDDVLTVLDIGKYNYVIKSEYRNEIIASPFSLAECFLKKE